MQLPILLVSAAEAKGEGLMARLARDGLGPVSHARTEEAARRLIRGQVGYIVNLGYPGIHCPVGLIREIRRISPVHPMLVLGDVGQSEALNEASSLGAINSIGPGRDAGPIRTFTTRVRLLSAGTWRTRGEVASAYVLFHGLSPRDGQMLVHALDSTRHSALTAALGISDAALRKRIQRVLRKVVSDTLDDVVAELRRIQCGEASLDGASRTA